MKPATLKHLNSAGGVIFRRQGEAFEIALIAIKNKTVWTLPKGIIDKGELPEATAIREIEEETGLRGKIVGDLGDKSYWFYLKEANVKCRKTVTYYLVEHLNGNIVNLCTEVDDAVWADLDKAPGLVTYRSDREIVDKAREKILKEYGKAVEQE